ncbi:MAG: H(+)-transporting two-sector ATPase [uncultured bacterium]|nr:MAG: H(+)-transporting two-sector ATPase [uncultured bacterium]
MRRFGMFLVLLALNLTLASLAMAEDGSGMGAVTGLALSAGLAIGLAAFGGAMGQGKAAYAALEGIARNPGAAAKIQTPMIIGLALIESLVIYALVIAFLLQGKIDALIK